MVEIEKILGKFPYREVLPNFYKKNQNCVFFSIKLSRFLEENQLHVVST
jgi:hypothetical protein